MAVWVWLILATGFSAVPCVGAVGKVVIAAYNVENWHSVPTGDPGAGAAKTEASKDAVVAVIAKHRPDILGLCEIGDRADLADLVARLEGAGLRFPHSEWHDADDPVRRLALLSRFPIVARDSERGVRFDLDGRPQAMARGVLDATVEVRPGYAIRVLGVHFKSRREVPGFDQATMRAREALHLRGRIERIIAAEPGVRLLVFGDFNDTRDAFAVREVIGPAGDPGRLTDLRPADLQGDRWTHYWETADVYARIDYLLVGGRLAAEVVPGSAGVDRSPEWRLASDHRMIFAAVEVPAP